LPITLKGTRDILPAGSYDLFPGTARMIIHPPISVESYTENTVEELMERVRKVIEDIPEK
jgi:1-acyl-sn-glycerol-3-phosphate acyltransferase